MSDLLRLRPDAIAMRTEADDGRPILHGYAARFNEWTEINSMIEGHFMERIAPGTFKRSIDAFRNASTPTVKCLFAHGTDPQIGFKVLGTFQRLEEDDQGLYYEVELDDTSYNRDLLPGLQRGQYGASFRAGYVTNKTIVERNVQRSDHNPQGIEERTHTELNLKELGPCTFGAYDGASSAVRSITDRITPLATPTASAANGPGNTQEPDPVRHSESNTNDHARLTLMLHQAGLDSTTRS